MGRCVEGRELSGCVRVEVWRRRIVLVFLKFYVFFVNFRGVVLFTPH